MWVSPPPLTCDPLETFGIGTLSAFADTQHGGVFIQPLVSHVDSNFVVIVSSHVPALLIE